MSVSTPLPATGRPAKIKKSPARLVLLLTAVASVGYLCRVDITVVAPRLMSDLHLSNGQMGTVFGAFLLGYTLLQVPGGWLAGRVPTRALFFALALGWAALTAAASLGLNTGWGFAAFPALVAMRFVLGALAAPTYPAASRAVSLSVKPSKQGRANGTVLASIGIGSALAPPLLGFVTLHGGWRAAMGLAALLAATAGIAWRCWCPDTAVTSARPYERTTVRDAQPFPRRNFCFLTASYALQGYVGYVFVFWFFLYLVQVRRFQLLHAAWLTTLPWLLSLVVIPLGGVASDWAVRQWGQIWGRRSLPMLALLFAAAALWSGAHTASGLVAAIALAVSTALVLATEGPYWATMTLISGARSGTAGGIMNFGCNLGGMVSPIVTPWLAARVGWETALGIAAALTVVAALLWLGVAANPNPSEAA